MHSLASTIDLLVGAKVVVQHSLVASLPDVLCAAKFAVIRSSTLRRAAVTVARCLSMQVYRLHKSMGLGYMSVYTVFLSALPSQLHLDLLFRHTLG